MYLVRPGELLWTNIGHVSPEDIIEMGGNLEAIDGWQSSERPIESSDVAVALRYGIPTRVGIVVAATHIIDQQRPRELREVHEKASRSQQHPQIQATTDFIDKYLVTGWKQQGDDRNRRIDEQSARSVQEAQEKARRQLEMPVKAELVEHWRSLGGLVPE